MLLDAKHLLGCLWADLVKLAEAEHMYERTTWWKEDAPGHNHTSTKDTYKSLGFPYAHQNELAGAEQTYGQNFQGQEKSMDDIPI